VPLKLKHFMVEFARPMGYMEQLVLSPCTIMMNNMKSKREEARENQDTELRGSVMCLRSLIF
jgi:hypothetical protein